MHEESNRTEKMTLRAVFHMDELAKMKLTLENMSNFLAWCGESETAREPQLIANSEAVQGLSTKKTNHGEEIAALHRDGAAFFMCRNAIGNFHVAESDLPGNVGMVTSGVVALAQRQQVGFAYTKL